MTRRSREMGRMMISGTDISLVKRRAFEVKERERERDIC